MTKRYAIRFEDTDGSLEAPFQYAGSKREAFRIARLAARWSQSARAVWVDDTRTDLGVKAFKTELRKTRA